MPAARYLIAKYIPDLFRGEPRNVGVVVWSPAGVAARFVAERSTLRGQVNVSQIPPFVTSPSAYRQWVEYWRGAVGRPTVKSFQRPGEVADRTTPAYLDLLAESSKGNFVLTLGGELLDDVTDPQAAADYLFNTLVATEDKLRHRTIAAACRPIIRKYKLDKDANFKQHGHVIKGVAGGVRDVMRFSYAYQNGSLRRLYQRVEVGGKQDVVTDGIHATAWKFDWVTKEMIPKDDAVSLVLLDPLGFAGFKLSPAGELLESVSRVVNVADTAAAEHEFGSLAALARH